MNSPRLIGATAMSGDGSDETSAAWERVTGDMSPGSSQLVQEAVSEPLREATRVMSPNPNDGVLTDVIAACQKCHSETHGPVVCTGCGSYGHTHCLNIEYFRAYPWCGACFVKTAQDSVQLAIENVQDQWIQTFPSQSAHFKEVALANIEEEQRRSERRADSPSRGEVPTADLEPGTGAELNSLGMPFSAEGGWACLVNGADRQIAERQAEIRGRLGLLRPKSAPPLRRPSLEPTSETCLACHTANLGHTAHTRTGDCSFQPGRSIFASNASTQPSPYAAHRRDSARAEASDVLGSTQDALRPDMPRGPITLQDTSGSAQYRGYSNHGRPLHGGSE